MKRIWTALLAGRGIIWSPSHRLSSLWSLLVLLLTMDLMIILFYSNSRYDITPSQSKEKFEADWEQRQAVRQKRVHEICNKLSPEEIPENLYTIRTYAHPEDTWAGPFLVDTTHRVLYCSIDKVASTSWKVLMANLTGTLQETLKKGEIHRKDILKRYSLRGIEEYSEPQVKFILRNYTKFMFVRHPAIRLLSAYRDKFELGGHGTFYQELYGKEIIKTQRWNPDENSLKTGEGVSFSELVRYIYHQRVFDPHWRRYFKVCMPCFINYDYIGMVETIAEDAHFILKRAFKRTHYIDLPKLHGFGSEDEGVFQEYMKTLTNEDIAAINYLYKIDMDLYGYDPVPYL